MENSFSTRNQSSSYNALDPVSEKYLMLPLVHYFVYAFLHIVGKEA